MDPDYESLFEQARMAVCSCWYYDLVDDGSVDEQTLHAIIARPMFLHYQEQEVNPQSENDFQLELLSCPNFTEPVY